MKYNVGLIIFMTEMHALLGADVVEFPASCPQYQKRVIFYHLWNSNNFQLTLCLDLSNLQFKS
jgi:hypothetical protein